MNRALKLSALKRAFALALCSACAALLPAQAAAQADDWTLDPYARIEVGTVSAKASTDDDQFIANGDGLVIRGQVGTSYEDDNTEIRVEADRISVIRFGEGRTDTDRDRLTASIEQELDDSWDVRLRVRHYDDLASAEFSDTDALEVSTRVTFEPERAHRFRLEATWREREYDDGDGPAGASTDGQGPRLSAEYRHRLGRYHYFNLSARAESIDSDNPDRNFSRQSVSASYTHPITNDLRVRPAIQLRHTRFGGRAVADTVRKDTYLAPEVEVLWWPGKVRVEAEAKYIFTSSTDPVRDREGYRLSLTVGYSF